MHGLPDFFVVGAAKSGTSSLYSYLAQHPDIFLPSVKEPNYYAYIGKDLTVKGPAEEGKLIKLLLKKTVTSRSDYLQLYEDMQEHQISGDCSPRYLYYPDVANEIASDVPNAKIVVVLRNPVNRGYSHFLMNRQRALEPLSDFKSAVDHEADRISDGWGWDWHYMSLGRYAEQLQRYYDVFPHENIFVVLHDHFVQNQHETMAMIYRFLEVDDQIEVDMSKRLKVAGTVGASDGYLGRLVFATETTWLGSLAIKLVPQKLGLAVQNSLRGFISTRSGGSKVEKLSDETIRYCWGKVESDMSKLEKMTGLDLSHWVPGGS